MRWPARLLISLSLCQLSGCFLNFFPDDPDPDPAPGPETYSPPPPPTCDDEACAGLGGRCHSGDGGRICLLDEPCDARAQSACNAGEVHACEQGLLVATAKQRCQDFEHCYTATLTQSSDAGTWSFAYCAVDPAPCAINADQECRGDVLVRCGLGFPSDEERCAAGKHCTEWVGSSGQKVAACADDVTCPAEVGQGYEFGIPLALACDHDSVIDCDSNNPYPFVVTDCSLKGEHCSTDVITTCTVAADGPAEPEWRSLPSGAFTPQIGLIAGVPTDVSAFEMLKTEVTFDQFEKCVRAGACRGWYACEPATDRGDAPVSCTLEVAAADYCAWLGGRLPTAAEWEYAARNAGQDVAFPWGDDPANCSDIGWRDASAAGDCDGEATVGCRHARDVTAQGLCDLAGNVSEWVARVDPSGASKRGQSYLLYDRAGPTTLGGGDKLYASGGAPDIGFRCVR